MRSGGLRKLPPLFVFSSVVPFVPLKRRLRSKNIQRLLRSLRRLNLSRLTFFRRGIQNGDHLRKKDGGSQAGSEAQRG